MTEVQPLVFIYRYALMLERNETPLEGSQMDQVK